METVQIVFKHQMSGASDAETDCVIDRETKTIVITQKNLRDQPFISSTHLITQIMRMLPDDIVAHNNDDVQSWTPVRTDWTIFVRLGELRFRAVFWNHMAGTCGENRTVELYLAPEESA